MMTFKRDDVANAAADVAKHANIEVTANAEDILVIADNSQALNEFETRLAAQTVVWEGPTALDAAGMLRTLTDIQGERTEFRPRTITDEWQARYAIRAQ